MSKITILESHRTFDMEGWNRILKSGVRFVCYDRNIFHGTDQKKFTRLISSCHINGFRKKSYKKLYIENYSSRSFTLSRHKILAHMTFTGWDL